jgi:hypothetical protein
MKRADLLSCVFVAAFALIAAPAIARPVASANVTGANIAGNWAFETEVYAGGCRMTGLMTISPNARGKHVCTFETRESCPDIVASAKQSCTATRTGNQLVVKSTVLSVIPKVGYDPDNFELTIKSGARMTGMMRSNYSAPVEFFRGDAPTS